MTQDLQIASGWGEAPSARYETLARRFRGLLNEIRASAAEREVRRILPHDHVRALASAGFTASFAAFIAVAAAAFAFGAFAVAAIAVSVGRSIALAAFATAAVEDAEKSFAADHPDAGVETVGYAP